MRIVSVINQKGGVGKTTTVANLGASLAARGLRTLLIDLDPQANLTLGLGADASDAPARHGLRDVLLNPDRAALAPIVRQIGELPLYLAPGHLEVADAETLLVTGGSPVYRLRRALDALHQNYILDWVLIDCPPSLGMLTQNAIVSSRHLLVPTQPTMYAFAGMDTLNKLVASLARDYKFEVDLLGVLLTMLERGTRVHRTIAGVIRERFGDRVFDTVITKNVRLAESEIEGKPIRVFDPQSTGAKNYDALADEVLRRVESLAPGE